MQNTLFLHHNTEKRMNHPLLAHRSHCRRDTPLIRLDRLRRPFPFAFVFLCLFTLGTLAALGGTKFTPASAGLCTKEIQAAIDDCHKSGGGSVRIPPGQYRTGTLKLKSGVHLVLENGAVLLGSQDINDYATDIAGCIEAPSFNRCLIYAENAVDIGLEGPGVIDGQGDPKIFLASSDPKNVPERPMLIRFVDCRNVRLSQINLKNAASWCCHLVGCERVWIDRCTIESTMNANNDGFDMDTCRDVFITDCHLRTGDDAICFKSTRLKPSENIIVSGCNISSKTAGVKLGTSSAGGFRNILVQNSIFERCEMGTLKVLCVDGGLLENVHFQNLIMDDCEGPIFVRLGRRGVKYDRPKEIVYDQSDVKTDPAKPGILRNCSFRNIRATVKTKDLARAGIMVTGIPGTAVENIRFEDIDITLPGGATVKDVPRSVPEDETRYPEQFFFGPLTSSAVFVRHASGVSFENLRISLESQDARPLFYVDDPKQVSVKNSQSRVFPEKKYEEVTMPMKSSAAN